MKKSIIVILSFIFTFCIIFLFGNEQVNLGSANGIDKSSELDPEIYPPYLESIPTEEEEEVPYLNGVFVASVINLDFPSEPNLSETVLKAEIDSIIQTSKSKGMSDIFFQVRPSSDALHYSDIFPPSAYVTGSQDIELPFDILEYFVSECHKNGLKLHAWINPYRVSRDGEPTSKIAEKYPDYVITHTDGTTYFDPGIPSVNELIVDGIMEIVNNYDVDGIHFDDYFYPSGEFDDSESYEKYANDLELGDFRRQNTQNLVEMTYNAIDEAKPEVSFGISPFSIWKNSSSDPNGTETRGNESYYSHHADTKKWVEMGILDYIAPQIYWHIGFEIADYAIIADWWHEITKNTEVDLYICHATYREVSGEFPEGEIDRQLEYNEDLNVSGSIFFRYEHIK